MGQGLDGVDDVEIEWDERRVLQPVEEASLAVARRGGAKGDPDVEDLDPIGPAEFEQPLQVGSDLGYEIEPLLQVTRPLLIDAESAHPALEMGAHVLHVDDQERRVVSIERQLFRFVHKVPIGVVNHRLSPITTDRWCERDTASCRQSTTIGCTLVNDLSTI